MSRPVRILREVALWLVAAIGTVCLVAAGAALAFGAKPLIFSSGSMSPGIPTGSLAISRSTSASEIRPGDIVSVVWSDGHRVTHRVTAVDRAAGGAIILTTRGDANNVDDAEHLTVTVVDRVLWSTPGLGFVIDEVTKPQWVFSLGVAVGGLVALVFLSTGRRARRVRVAGRSHRRERARPHKARGVVLASTATAAIVAVSLVLPGATSTEASFADQGAASGSFGTATITPPTITACAINNFLGIFQSVTVSFAMPAGYSAANAVVGTGSTQAALAASSPAPTISGSGPYSVTYSSNLISTLLGSLFGSTMWIGIRTQHSAWTSAWSSRKVSIGLAGLGSTCTTT